MTTSLLEEVLKPKISMARMIWFFLTLSIGSYLLVAYLVIHFAQLPPPRVAWAGVLKIALLALSVGQGFLSLILFRRLPGRRRIEGALAKPIDLEALLGTPHGGEADAELLRKGEQLSEVERKIVALYPLFLSSWIVSWALNEAIAIYGLVAATLLRSFPLILPFAALAILLNLLMRPRLELVRERTTLPLPPADPRG